MRGVAERAAALGDRLAGGPPAPPEAPADAAASPPPVSGPLLRREGEYWAVVFAGDVVRVRDGKGIAYLAALLANPGREMPALDLVAREPDPAAAGDSGPILDAPAKAAYRRRLAELRAERAEAEARNDPGRASRAAEEMDALSEELSRAIGLGGRGRTAGSAAERARQSVTRALKRVLGTLAAGSPALGEHLARSVKTGTFCAYEPDPLAGIRWTVEASRPRRG